MEGGNMNQTDGDTSGCKKHFTKTVGFLVSTGMVLSGCSGSNETAPTVKDKRPNILVIMADDMGYSDIQAFGSEINTPNLNQLVANGRILTNHHSGTVSSIARSMLMSGTDHHLVGEGALWYGPRDERKAFPGYEGHLKDTALSVAQLLKDGGYHTYMVGKWDLGDSIPGNTDPTKVGKSPDQWGFERTYALLPGAVTNQYAHEPANSTNYAENGVYVRPNSGEYSTDFWTQKLIKQINADRGDGKPFFAYASYVAPHWPLQVDPKWSDKYRGRYDQGYDSIRAARIVRMKDRGIIPLNMAPFPGVPETKTMFPGTANNNTAAAKYMNAVKSPALGYPDYIDYGKGTVNLQWNSLSATEKKVQARYMEVYAGMVENLDYNIGLLIQHLKDIGEYDNTFIVFLSDNGPDGYPWDGGYYPSIDTIFGNEPLFSNMGFDNGLEIKPNDPRPAAAYLAVGSAWPYLMYGQRWAEVGAAPFAHTKGSSSEGGISVPCIVRMPNQKAQLPHYTYFTHITDITATILDLAGITTPTKTAPALMTADGVNKNAGKVEYASNYVYPVTGKSLLPLLKGEHSGIVRYEPFGGESYGRAYMFGADGRWKARWQEPPTGPADGRWELFDMMNDRGETTDLSAMYPTYVDLLRKQWENYMTSVNAVEPVRPHSYYPDWWY
jgi:arylsulfatase A-like enzyme